jgi:hypothetical protein
MHFLTDDGASFQGGEVLRYPLEQPPPLSTQRTLLVNTEGALKSTLRHSEYGFEIAEYTFPGR